MLEADSSLTAVLFTFFGIPLSFFASLLTLYQFKRAYVLISVLAQKRVKNSTWRAVRPCASWLEFLSCNAWAAVSLHFNYSVSGS